MIEDEIVRRATKIRLLALDVDGVLTEGGVYVLEDGTELRRFDIKDGLGIKLLMTVGVEVVLISGATSTAVINRARTLGVNEVLVGVVDKLEALLSICERLHIALEEVAYVGDDLPDLPVLKQVGLPCAPVDAVTEVLRQVLYVTRHSGGHGAVREIADVLIEAHGRKQD